MRLDAARAWLTGALAAGESPRADADALLCHLLGRDRGYLLSWPERELTGDQLVRLEGWLARRQGGEPIAHILGEREFWSLPLLVSPATLIPRPDTEVLVELALARLPAAPARVLDLGTGTGAIALALKSERADDEVWAVDAQPDAVALARRNSERLRLPLLLRLGSWFEPLGDAPRFDLIVSNPPYIDGEDPHLAQGDVRFEPLSALVADEAGLADLRHIVRSAPAHLVPGGWLLLEHGWQQGACVRELLAEAGYDAIETVRDYGDNDRVTLGRFQGIA
ncbi:protein-(glutamine-N5) methyltransferase, release factor-specific [Aeromonas schubertii]|uniref:peptide chain release factor N(5)-glutamine methyltransferase n=1 Tax=Aeromonas schubertii TaxID=652 RepID=UPI00067ED17A|nr:peptide chain release factor N(5)-glutamine methyltransferase [Aeromonas schubertii]KUE78756.1 protein-(glutamine-N5) methyltransferase, release factor-specific [Aeromonas schubertii]